MAVIELSDYQLEAISKMKNGCILCGGVGSGKSRTALAYYYQFCGGKIGTKKYVPMTEPRDLYIITTARKRDTLEWESEFPSFLISTHPELSRYKTKVVVDSWNNIKKYRKVSGAFFIFDEQRLIGRGVWVKSFLDISRKNPWILLSATPGDTWSDYIPVFVANGFYKNRTSFQDEHVVWSRFTKYPKVERYLNTGKLIRLRRSILVDMDYHPKTIPHHEILYSEYNITAYKAITETRWNPYTQKPVKTAAELCYLWRKIVNTDDSRQVLLLEIFEKHPKLIVFYNYNYELEILRNLYYGEDVAVAEWNGHEHQPIPDTERWVYLVQYAAGAEGWNCVKTDTIVFFSPNYSYKAMIQAAGRIDRRNTPFVDLFYFHLRSRSPIDLGISRTLKAKKNFNESQYAKFAMPVVKGS